MALQRLVCARQLVQHRIQDPLAVWGGNEPALVIDDADHEPPALVLLCLDDLPQGDAEFGELEAGRASAWSDAWTSVLNCCSTTALTTTPPSSTTMTKSRYTLSNWTRRDRRAKCSIASTPG